MKGSPRARVILVGHCSPDAAMMRTALQRAVPGAVFEAAGSDEELARAGANDILLVNRVLDGDFAAENGIALIRSLRSRSEPPVVLLVSNLAAAQDEAVAAGALPGFGKTALYAEETQKRLQAAAERAAQNGVSG